ncbi:AarF/ABC1/UbiB kinase family protein [Aquihabitans sp. G128]|uniref:ABC1 kinase family protein n=1 Tax=Aquihabitans sp. G128 TaxID=2849779 RepID=UPI001C24A7B1|nr:AarF/UbiB family protein [Aquihabitans sp. G128]QXC61510.1 AarF/ABC1/UbiB kinase family protein [Aquihabitans sp. G128]
MPDADRTAIEGPADVAWAAFSSVAPWVLPDEQLAWQRPVAAERLAVAAELPELTRRRLLPPGTRIVRTARHLGLGVGIWYLGARRQGGVASRTDLAHRLRVGAERLGPTYIKLGQIISSGQGLFPPELVDEFALLRDRVPAERFAVIREVVEAELGRPLDEVFSHFERTPIAAASIAQAHAATLRTGEEVVVKVQRPSVGERVHADLKVMAWIAPFLIGRIPVAALANPPALVDLFAETITEELDFRLEADNMVEVARSYASLGQRGYVIPRPHPTLVTKRVLVMERFRGFAFDDVVGMHDAGIDTEAVVRTGMVGFLEGCMFNGIFHGDLHGGNLLVLPDGRTGLLDFGITGRLPEAQRLAFLRLLVGASMNDVTSQLAALRDLGALPPDADLAGIIVELGLDKPPVDPASLTAEQLTGEIQRIMKALLGYGARLPKPLMLFVKNLVFLDGAITTLAPDLDLFAEITQIAMYFTTQHGERIAAEVGLAADDWALDLSGVKATFGTEAEAAGSITHRELRERRQLIADRMEQRPRGSRRARLRRLVGRRRR